MTETANVMEVIWQSVDKTPEGVLHYPIEFIDFLWDYGFVDAKKYPRQEWHAAFEPFRQADGTFRITHEEFLSLDKYRYRGEIRIPFDAMRINEGKYTDEGFGQLVHESIAPSCVLEPSELHRFMEELKKEFRQADDLILIKAPAKQKIKTLLEDSPSPLRRLELMFDVMLKNKGIAKQVEEDLQRVSTVATPQQLAALQASTFTMGPSSLAESQAGRLKQIAKTKASEEPAPEAEGEPLKKIRRSKKGVRG